MASAAGPVASIQAVVPAFGWGDVNPLLILGNAVAVGVTDVWQSFMTSLWGGGLWLTRFAFNLVDAFTSPDLSEGGVMKSIFPVTFAIGAGLALILGVVQLGAGAWQRDGKGLARLIVGLGQFMLAWGGMLGVGAALTVATSGLTQGMLQVALGAPSFGSANLLKAWDPRQGIDAAAATVLGLLGFILVFAAIGYLLVMLVRAGALMILMATSPISAAGLLNEGTRSWFWKSLRWFIAALMIGPLAALVLGIGKLLTDGLLSGAGSSTESAVGTAVLGTVLVLLSAFSPLILFKLLAFVDPGTSSGASFRASLDSAGGLAGLLGGQGPPSDAGSGAATAQASDGSSQGEADAGSSTQGRLASAMGGLGTAADKAATYSADILGAAGVGHQQPYFGSPTSNGNGSKTQQPRNDEHSQQDGASPDDPGTSGGPGTCAAPLPSPPVPSPPVPGPSGSDPGAGADGGGAPAGGAGAGGAAGGAAGGVEGAAAVAAL